MQENTGAVLTGDIIRSQRFDLATRESIRREIASATERLRQSPSLNGALPLAVQQFRGDGWQLPVRTPGVSLRVCLLLRGQLRVHFNKEGIDTRICIGVGEMPEAAMFDGEAYILSGQGLDAMPKRGGANLALTLSPKLGEWQGFASAIQPMLHAVDYLVERWTAKQAEAVLRVLDPSFGRGSRVKQPNERVTRYTLERAGWPVIQGILAYFEKELI
jgi:hypothetical protein